MPARTLILCQSKPKGGSQPRCRAHIDGFVMRFQNMFDDRESQSRSSFVSGPAFVDPVKTVKEMPQMFRFYSDAIVRYFDQNMVIHVVKSHLGFSSFLTIFYRITDQIHQHGPERFPVCKNHKIVGS